MIVRMVNVILGARSITPFSFSFFLSVFELKEDPLVLQHSLTSQATDLTLNLQHRKQLIFSSITKEKDFSQCV